MSTHSEDLVRMGNELLLKLNDERRVDDWGELNADYFVTVLESLFGEPLKDIVRPSRSREDDVHNCQVVIDTLSLDILNAPMSHITGEAIVAGNRISIHNLLEVILGLVDYLNEKIGSDVSSVDDNGTEDPLHSMEDPDLVTPEVIDNVLQRELGPEYQRSISSHSSVNGRDIPMTIADLPAKEAQTRNSQAPEAPGDSTAELIALGQASGYSDTSHANGEATEDLIALGRTPHREKANDVPDLHKPDNIDALHTAAVTTAQGPPSSLSYTIPATSMITGTATSHKEVAVPVISAQDALRSNKLRREPPIYGTTDSPPVRDSVGRYSDKSYPHASTAPVLSGLSGLPSTSRNDYRHTAPPDLLHSKGVGLDSSIGSSVIFPHQQTGPVSAQDEFATLGLPRSHTLRPTSTHGPVETGTTRSYHLYHHFDRPGMPSERELGISSAATVVTQSTGVNTSPGLPLQPPATTTCTSTHPYQNLQSLVQDTVALSRAAVSPRSSRVGPSSGLDRSVDQLAQDLRSQHLDMQSSQPRSGALPASGRPAAELSQSRISTTTNNSLGSPHKSDEARARRKVSFRTNRSTTDDSRTTDSSLDSRLALRPDIAELPEKSSLRQYYEHKARIQESGRPQATRHKHEEPTALRVGMHRTTPWSREKPSSPGRPRQTNAAGLGVSERKAQTTAVPPPKNFKEYMRKYYGHDRLQSMSDSEVDYGDDGMEYSRDADISELDSDVDQVGRRGTKRPGAKAVRFDALLDDSSAGRMESIRQKLKGEDKRAQLKTDFLNSVFKDGLYDMKDDIDEHMDKYRKQAEEKEKEYVKKAMTSKQKKPKLKKKTVPSSVLYNPTSRPLARARSQSRPRSTSARRRSVSASPTIGRFRDPVRQTADQEILPWLLEEFPYLHLSTETLHDMWRKSSRQVEQLSKAEQEVRRRKSRAQIQIEEAERRQTILMDIVKKEVQHSQRVRDLKDRQRQKYTVKATMREKRQQSARARRYYDDYQVRMRSKMLKKRTKEELIFRKLFKEGLDIQKDRIRELRKYAREQRDVRARKQQDKLESLENYYRAQFALLSEAMANEKDDMEIREHAQNKVLEQMQKELRKKMEREIREIQEQIYRDEDDAYFRELDADRLREQLHVMRYQAHV